jgi:hypothetical protein
MTGPSGSYPTTSTRTSYGSSPASAASGIFIDSTPGDPDGRYETVSPSDEYRILFATASGWRLDDLDGTSQYFLSNGRWDRTEDRNGNTTQASYDPGSGKLSAISFPDGRMETFAYDTQSGKLASITEHGVGGGATRTWTYVWAGDRLSRIERPDGTGSRLLYQDPLLPGYLTELSLLEPEPPPPTPRTARVERAWQYDGTGNVTATWRGSSYANGPDHPDAVEVWKLAFDDNVLPTETTVTDPLGDTIVYTLDRDPASLKPRIQSIMGGCPGCGLESDTTFEYTDASNPLPAHGHRRGAG